MSLYAVVKGDWVDGIAVSESPLDTDGVWILVDNVVPQPAQGWFYKDGVFSPPSFPPPSPPPPNIITKVAFRFRFTDAEYAGIITAARTDAEVQVWYDTFNMLTVVDLDNQRTKDGVANLVSKNLLTQARADEILTAPVQPNERA
jgi:hypothetical protein